MPVSNPFQDFADRHYEYFGGRVHFGFLARAAKKFGVSRCDEVVSTMKQFQKNLEREKRINYFTATIHSKNKK